MAEEASASQSAKGNHIAQADRSSIAIVGDGNIVYATPPSRVPLHRPRRPINFTGRQEELAKLLNLLQPGHVVTLCGPAGIGKTALVREAIWRLAPGNEAPVQFPDGIILHHFYNQPEVHLALENIVLAYGEELDPTPVIAAQRVLSGRQALLILDGAENADDLSALLEVAGSCGILITSRRKSDAPDPHLRLDILPLSDLDALQLLQAWYGSELAAESAIPLISQLGSLPLALCAVGRYLAETGETVTEYSAWLEQAPFEALDPDETPNSVPSVLKLSLEQVDESARRVLAVISQLALAPITLSVVTIALTHAFDLNQIKRGIRQLTNYSLLNRDGDVYEISHALIYSYARQRLEDKVTMMDFFGLINYYQPFIYENSEQNIDGFDKVEKERNHITELLDNCIKHEQIGCAADLAIAVIFYLERTNIPSTGWIRSLQLSLKTFQLLEVLEQQEVATLNHLGIAYHRIAQLDEAIDCYHKGLEICQKIGERRGEGGILLNLGNVYADIGLFDQALIIFQHVLTIHRELQDREGEMFILNNLATISQRQNKDEACEYYQSALVIAQELGSRRFEGRIRGNLGGLYREIDQFDKAKENLQQALNIAHEFGDQDIESDCLANLGLVYLDLKNFGQAIKLLEQALTIAREIKDKRNEGKCLSSLGSTYLLLKQFEQATAYYTKAVVIFGEIGDLYNKAHNILMLGAIHGTLGQIELAKDYFQQALHDFEVIKSPFANIVRGYLEKFEQT